MSRPIIHASSRATIYKLYLRCLGKKKSVRVSEACKIVSEISGKSLSTIRRIVLEGKTNNGKFVTPGQNRTGRPKKYLDGSAIKEIIQIFYSDRNIKPTLRNLLPVLREELGYDGSREHLRQVLKTIGFEYKKVEPDRKEVKLENKLSDNDESSEEYTSETMDIEYTNVEYLDESIFDSD